MFVFRDLCLANLVKGLDPLFRSVRYISKMRHQLLGYNFGTDKTVRLQIYNCNYRERQESFDQDVWVRHHERSDDGT